MARPALTIVLLAACNAGAPGRDDPWTTGAWTTADGGSTSSGGGSESTGGGTGGGMSSGAGSGGSGGATGSTPGPVDPAPDLLPVADPKLDGFDGWPLPIDVEVGDAEGATCVLELDHPGYAVDVLEAPVVDGRCEPVWDGRLGGDHPTPAVLEVRVDVQQGGSSLGTTSFSLEVVRLGIAALRAQGPERVPLLYWATGGSAGEYWTPTLDRPIWKIGPDANEPAGAVSLELADGTPRPSPTPWTDLRSPPLDGSDPGGIEDDTYSLPIGVTVGAPLTLEATLTTGVAGDPDAGAPTLAPVRIVPPTGWAGGAQAFAPGDTATASLPAAAPAVGRQDLAPIWRFEAQTGDGSWHPMPGQVTSALRIYGLVGQPTLGWVDEPHQAWLEVVDAVAGWVDGATGDPTEVAGIIVDAVYRDANLVYSGEGAPAYTWFGDFDTFQDADFELGAYLERAFGSTINCSDAGSIVVTHANMVGVDLRYRKLVADFPLHYIRPIGLSAFTNDPFGDGKGFSFHAVIEDASGDIYDATLALDGDGQPGYAPHVELLAAGMNPGNHASTLSPGWVNAITGGKPRLR